MQRQTCQRGMGTFVGLFKLCAGLYLPTAYRGRRNSARDAYRGLKGRLHFAFRKCLRNPDYRLPLIWIDKSAVKGQKAYRFHHGLTKPDFREVAASKQHSDERKW